MIDEENAGRRNAFIRNAGNKKGALDVLRGEYGKEEFGA
jgi:hypothetical protein